MGYRSNVRIRLTKEDYTKLKDEFTKKLIDTKVLGYNLFEDLNVYTEATNIPYYDDNDCICSCESVYFGWDWVKWYDGYEDVDFIMEFIQQDGRPYAFARVGESSEGDIDYHSYGFDDIWTTIIFDDPSEDDNHLCQRKWVKYDYEEDDDGAEIEVVVVDDTKYINLDYHNSRVDELEGKFNYECECNKDLVDMQNKFEQAREIVDYLSTHNKNYNNTQYNKILELQDILKYKGEQ